MSEKKSKEEATKYSNARYVQALVSMAELFNSFEDVAEKMQDDNIMLHSVRVKLPEYGEEDYLVCIKAYEEGRAVVAFHGASSFSDVLMGVVQRMRNRSLKWKDDRYAKKGESKGKGEPGDSDGS